MKDKYIGLDFTHVFSFYLFKGSLKIYTCGQYEGYDLYFWGKCHADETGGILERNAEQLVYCYTI